MKKILIGLLTILTTFVPCYARGNYSYSVSQQESYSASSPVGTTVVYKNNAYDNRMHPGFYPPQENFYPVNMDNGGYLASNVYQYPDMMDGTTYVYNDVRIPQAYNKSNITTHRYIDERENIDKNIDRAQRIVGTLGGAAVLGLGIAALITAL